MAAGARHLLTGRPGSDKSTFLDWVALQVARSKQALPLFVSLRNYTSDLRDLLRVSVERFAPETHLFVPGCGFRKLWPLVSGNSGQVVVLI